MSHDQCECYMARREHISGFHTGLWCRPHNKWIKWLSDQEILELIEIGVETRDPPPLLKRRSQTAKYMKTLIDNRIKDPVLADKMWREITNKNR